MSGPTTGTLVLSVDGISKRFGGLQALQSVHMTIKRGDFHAIIGPNGAGKSTFFNTLTGLLQADEGRIVFEGRNVSRAPPHQRTQLGMGRTFQITHVFRSMTVLENVQVALMAQARQTWQMWRLARNYHTVEARRLLDMVGLSAQLPRMANTLAHGDQKRLELAIALACRPTLLLLDEPTAGMAAQERLESIRLVQQVAMQLGISCVFTEHDMAVVFAVADHITVLHQGKVLAQGSPQEVRASPLVQQVYLGESVDAAGVGA
ncbi:MAG: ABC transporter ATP-binding protein [Burkholderiaceae bacterium]